MKLKLARVESLTEALELAPHLDRCAAQFWREFSDQAWPAGASERFLRRLFEAPETVLLTARDSSRAAPWGICLSGPLEDPLRGDRTPTILVLHVDEQLRRRGVARELVDELWLVLERRGLTRLAARVGHNDDALISMGERWGFVRAWEWIVRE